MTKELIMDLVSNKNILLLFKKKRFRQNEKLLAHLKNFPNWLLCVSGIQPEQLHGLTLKPRVLRFETDM